MKNRSLSSSSKWCKKCKRKFKGKKCPKSHKKGKSRGKHKSRVNIENNDLESLIKKGRLLFHKGNSSNIKDPYDNLRKLNEIRDALPGPRYKKRKKTPQRTSSNKSKLIIKPVLHGRRKTKSKSNQKINPKKFENYFFLDF